MDEKLAQFEAYRKQEFKKANMFSVFGVLGIILGMILFMGFDQFPFLGMLLFIGGAIVVGVGASIKSKVQKKFKEEFIVNLVKETYPGCTYNPKMGLDLKELMEPGFFRRPDRYFSEDLLIAEYEGIPFTMVDYTFQDERRTTDSKGHTRVTYVTYAKGRHMVFDFKREFNQVVKVLETRGLGANVRGLEKIDTESINFNEKFDTYTSDSLTAFYVLTPQIQEKLLELETKFKGSIFFAFMNGKFYLSINDNVDTLDMSLKGEINEQTLDHIRAQLNVPAAVIHELKLSGDKYNSGDAI